MSNQEIFLTLSQYLHNRKDIDVSKILEVLSDGKNALKPGALNDLAIWPLIESAQSIDDVVAAATIVRSYANRRSVRLFSETASRLEKFEISQPAKRMPDAVREVALISSVTVGHHLKLIYAYAYALLTQRDINKVRILFTGEWTWAHWKKNANLKLGETLRNAFLEQLRLYPEPGFTEESLEQRLSIELSPRPEEMAELLGDVVIRFEGPAHFKTTFLYGEAIHKLRPVLTATFSSYVADCKNSDKTLVRAKSDNKNLLHFVPPAAMALPILKPHPIGGGERLIVSAYAQERIKNCFAAMSESEWGEISRLFDQTENAKWLLVGSNNPAEARAAIPKGVERKYADRIEILPFSKLDEIYKKTFAFLALPRVFGGGGGATMAISSGVPVLVSADPRSDIANTLPDELLCSDFSNQIDLLINWSSNPGERQKFILDQQKVLAARMDLKEKGRELLGHLNAALKERKEKEPAQLTDAGCTAGIDKDVGVMAAESFCLKNRLPLRGLLNESSDIDQDIMVSGLARLGYATNAGEVCFCDRLPSDDLKVIVAGSIILCTPSLYGELTKRFPDVICVVQHDPRASFIDLGHRLLAGGMVEVGTAIPRPFRVHPSVQIGAHAVIHPEVRIDEGAKIGAQCVIHRGTWIKAGAVIRDNTVVGVEGINAYRGLDGRQRNFPHFASVIIGENVEIGAGAVVVRGILNSTRIGRDSVIGNLSNIGHVVEIGEKVWMSVGCLIGGHTRIGAGATLGMGVAVRDNVEIGENAQVGMASVVVKSVAANTSVFGNPARVTGPIQAGPAR